MVRESTHLQVIPQKITQNANTDMRQKTSELFLLYDTSVGFNPAIILPT